MKKNKLNILDCTIHAKNILDFGLQVKNKRFKFESNYAVLPNSLGISYALGVCTSGESKKICALTSSTHKIKSLNKIIN
jgi:hypothetical protein